MTMTQQQGPQRVQTAAVRVYQTDGRLMVAAPLPGLEPEDISVTIQGTKVTIHGELRGPRQNERQPLTAEWAVGPYYRELTLPHPVDGARTNATYGNGVLVLVMPKPAPGQPGSDVTFKLEVVRAPHGERVGHYGREMRETTTAEHLQRMEQTLRSAKMAPHVEPAGPARQPLGI